MYVPAVFFPLPTMDINTFMSLMNVTMQRSDVLFIQGVEFILKEDMSKKQEITYSRLLF